MNSVASRVRGGRLCITFSGSRRYVRRTPHRLRRITCSSVEPKLLEIFAAVSEGRLSPVDAAQTVEERLRHKGVTWQSAFPQVLNGSGKRPEWIAQRMKERLWEEGRVLVTDITPSDYAEIRKSVPGVIYHAGAKTLKLDRTKSTPKLPGSVAVVTDSSVSTSTVEEFHAVAEYLGCYTFQIQPLSVTQLPELLEQTSKASCASVVVVMYDQEKALPDVVSGAVDTPVISVDVGKSEMWAVPSGTLSCGSVTTAAYGVAKVLNSAHQILARQDQQTPSTEGDSAEEEAVVVNLNQQIQDALEILNDDDAARVRRVNNVVSSEVREAAAPSDSPLP